MTVTGSDPKNKEVFKAPVQVFRFFAVAGRNDMFMFSCALCVKIQVKRTRKCMQFPDFFG
jgi:hypothetical protein